MNLVVSQSTGLDSLAVSVWHLKAGGFTERHWSCVHIEKLKKLHSNINKETTAASGSSGDHGSKSSNSKSKESIWQMNLPRQYEDKVARSKSFFSYFI